jgi:hypothetical protein
MELGLEFLNSKMQEDLKNKDLLEDNKGDEKQDEPVIEDITKKENTEHTHTEEKDDSSSKVKNSSPYVLLAKHLAEEGLLSEEYLNELEEDDSINGLTSALYKQLDTITETKLKNYGPEIQEFVSLTEAGVDRNTAKALVKESFDLNKITDDLLETDEKVQENVVKQYLIKLGQSEDEIEEQIEYLKDTDKLYSKSINYKSKLDLLNKQEIENEKRKAALMQEENKRNTEKILSDVRSKIDSYNEIVPGVKVPKNVKEKIFKNLTTPVAIDENNNPVTFIQSVRAKDPINFEILLNYYAEIGLFDGKFDSIIKGTKTKTVEELEKTLSSSNLFDKGVSTVVKTVDSKEEQTARDIASSIPGSLEELFNFNKK